MTTKSVPAEQPPLKTIWVKLSRLRPDPRNTRKRTKKNIEAIRASYKEFGQQRPILVTKKGVIVAGHGQYQVAKELGFEKMAVNITNLEDARAMAYGTADNRSAELSEWNLPILGDVLQDLREHGMDLATIGFDIDDYEKLFMPDAIGGTTTTTTTTKTEAIRAGQEWLVVIECSGEDEQQELFEELRDRGLTCKIMS